MVTQSDAVEVCRQLVADYPPASGKLAALRAIPVKQLVEVAAKAGHDTDAERMEWAREGLIGSLEIEIGRESWTDNTGQLSLF